MYEILKSYSQHIIKKQSSIRDAMKKIDALGSNYTSIINYKFLVLLDDSNKLLGTITDGDIRRSILKGENLDSSVENAASLNPHFGILNRENENKNKLSKVINDTYFLPIVDKNFSSVSEFVEHFGSKNPAKPHIEFFLINKEF